MKMITIQKEKVYAPKILTITAITAIALTVLLSFKRESKMPQSHVKDHDYVASWVNENLDLNDVIQVCPTDFKLNFYFRIYHKRAIFWGNEFPFDQASFKTWLNRKNKIEIAEKTGEFQNLNNQIDYIVIPNNYQINKSRLTIVKKFAQFTIFKINC